jgi:hypothetical protein
MYFLGLNFREDSQKIWTYKLQYRHLLDPFLFPLIQLPENFVQKTHRLRTTSRRPRVPWPWLEHLRL